MFVSNNKKKGRRDYDDYDGAPMQRPQQQQFQQPMQQQPMQQQQQPQMQQQFQQPMQNGGNFNHNYHNDYNMAPSNYAVNMPGAADEMQPYYGKKYRCLFR